MEKNKDIPGWYHRLSNLKTKPASQITFKQYCQENETRMRILYPFLPHDQIKGKLLSYWKRKQPPEHKSLERNGFMKHKKPLKHPVVHLLSRPSANSKVAPVKKTTLPPEWLSGAGSVKAGDKGGKTYKWRAFVLPNKVPEVISQPSNHERSILKNGRQVNRRNFKVSSLPPPFLFTTVLSHWDVSHGKFGVLSLRKASCKSCYPTLGACCLL